MILNSLRIFMIFMVYLQTFVGEDYLFKGAGGGGGGGGGSSSKFSRN